MLCVGPGGGQLARALILTRLWAKTPCPHQTAAPSVPVDGQVVTGQPTQRPRQHRRGQVRGPTFRQHAKPLVISDMDQPRVLLLAAGLIPFRPRLTG